MNGVFDTSALIKLVIQEEGTERARQLWAATSVHTVSALAYPESRSAVGSALRTHRLRAADEAAALDGLDQLWMAAVVVDLDPEIAVAAGHLAASSGLKGAEAVHLATATEVAGEADVFVTWNRQLSRAARAVGLAVAP